MKFSEELPSLLGVYDFAYLVKDFFLFVKMLFVINGLCEKLVVLGQKNGHVTHEVLAILFQGTIDLNIKNKFH